MDTGKMDFKPFIVYCAMDAAEQAFSVTCMMKDIHAMQTPVSGYVQRTVKISTASNPAEAEQKAIEFYKKRGYTNVKVTSVSRA